ncbi:MAG: hypothetical protein R3F60_00610 [bacterium]
MVPCSRCGKESPDGSLHCVHCGTRVGDDGLARTQMGMPVIKPVGGPGGGLGGGSKPAGLLAGLPALRTKTTSPLVSGEFSLHPAGSEEPLKTMVGMPIYEGALRAEVPSEPAPLAPAEDEEPAPTVAMQGLTDAQLAEEPAPTVALQGLTDAQVAASAPQDPGPTVVVTPTPVTAQPEPVRPTEQPVVTQARVAAAPGSGSKKWVILVLVLAAAGALAWFATR